MALDIDYDGPILSRRDLVDRFANVTIKATGTVTNPATVEAHAHAEGTVTNPESEDA